MGKFIFDFSDKTRHELTKVEFDVSDNLSISEFKLICKRMAASMGYSPVSIERTFGNDTDEDFDDETYVELNVAKILLD